MNKQDLILSLNEETFFALKKDFDTILNRTLGNMEMKGATDATITLKLIVGLDERSVSMGDSIQKYKKPTFKHEISSVMQIKDKMTGQLGGEYAMVWDTDEERFVLRHFDNNQTSIFDGDYEEYDEPMGSFANMPADEAIGLPAPENQEEPEEVVTPFGWLSQFVGENMVVTEAMGNYTVRTSENKIVLSSATTEDNPFYCPAERLEPHVGHNVVCVGYGDDEIVNVSIECEDCNSVLFDINAPEATDEEVTAAVASADADEVETEDDPVEKGLDYEYPEEYEE